MSVIDNSFNSIPSSTMLYGQSNGLMGDSVMSWVSAPITSGVQSMMDSLSSYATTVVDTTYDLGSKALEYSLPVAKSVGTTALNTVTSHPYLATLAGVGAVATNYVIAPYLQGWFSSGTVRACSDEAHQKDSVTRMENLATANHAEGEFQSLKQLFDDSGSLTVKNGGDLAKALSFPTTETNSSQHILDNLESYAMRGAHIALDDGGALFKGMIHDLIPEQVIPEDPKALMDQLDKKDFPKGMIQRNSTMLNGSSHYDFKKGNRGSFEGIKQFGVDIEGGGHLLFGLRKVGEKYQSWLQFEGHGLSTWSDFSGHAKDLFRHLGSGKGQVGPTGYCPFTEKNNLEIVLT